MSSIGAIFWWSVAGRLPDKEPLVRKLNDEGFDFAKGTHSASLKLKTAIVRNKPKDCVLVKLSQSRVEVRFAVTGPSPDGATVERRCEFTYWKPTGTVTTDAPDDLRKTVMNRFNKDMQGLTSSELSRMLGRTFMLNLVALPIKIRLGGFYYVPVPMMEQANTLMRTITEEAKRQGGITIDVFALSVDNTAFNRDTIASVIDTRLTLEAEQERVNMMRGLTPSPTAQRYRVRAVHERLMRRIEIYEESLGIVLDEPRRLLKETVKAANQFALQFRLQLIDKRRNRDGDLDYVGLRKYRKGAPIAPKKRPKRRKRKAAQRVRGKDAPVQAPSRRD